MAKQMQSNARIERNFSFMSILDKYLTQRLVSLFLASSRFPDHIRAYYHFQHSRCVL